MARSILMQISIEPLAMVILARKKIPTIKTMIYNLRQRCQLQARKCSEQYNHKWDQICKIRWLSISN